MSTLEQRDEPEPAVVDVPEREPLPRADMVMATIFLVMFAGALWGSRDWAFRTALFPRVVTVLGCIVTLLFLATSVWRWWSQPVATDEAAPPTRRAGEPELVDEDDEHDQEVEYIFATAGRSAWTAALGWVALFVVLIYLTGLFVSAAVFALTYLRWSAERSWVFAIVYAAVLTGVLYVGLQVALTVPVPTGVLLE